MPLFSSTLGQEKRSSNKPCITVGSTFFKMKGKCCWEKKCFNIQCGFQCAAWQDFTPTDDVVMANNIEHRDADLDCDVDGDVDDDADDCVDGDTHGELDHELYVGGHELLLSGNAQTS